jgi:hypothetical protein
MANHFNATARERPDPFQPRWTLRVTAAGVAIAMSVWFMVIGIIG